MVIGEEKVTLLTHYLLPCSNGKSIYSNEQVQRPINVTQKFNTWCEEFTKDIIQVGLNKFCSQGGSNVQKAARKARNRVMKMTRHHQEKRFLPLVALGVSACVSVLSGWSIIKSHQAQTSAQRAEELAREGLEHVKDISMQAEQLQQRFDKMVDIVNVTLDKLNDLDIRIRELELQSSIENQALVSTLVFKANTADGNLEQISEG